MVSVGPWRWVFAFLLGGSSPLLVGCGPSVQKAGHSQPVQERNAAASPSPDQSASPQAQEPSTERQAPSGAQQPPDNTLQPLSPAAQDGLQSFGVGGGIAVEAASRDGHWVAYCEPQGTAPDAPLDMAVDARGAPQLPVTLTLGTARGRFVIDRLLAADPTGRFVATLEEGSAILRDTEEGTSRDLSGFQPDLTPDGLPRHRSFAFSKDGNYLVILTKQGSTSQEQKEQGRKDPSERVQPHGAILLDLNAAFPLETARRIDLGERLPWRVTAHHQAFSFATLSPQTPSSKWPAPPPKSPQLRCTRAGYAGYARISGPLRDPAVEHLILWPDEAASSDQQDAHLTARPAPGFVLAVGSGWVRRTEQGRLLLVQGAKQRQIASSRCGARILHVDPETGLFLAACEEYRPVPERARERGKNRRKKPKYRFELYLLRPGFVHDLQADIMRTGVDVPVTEPTSLVALRPGSEAALVDFHERQLIRLEPGESVVATGERGALVRQGKALEYFDLKRRVPVAEGVSPFTPIERTHSAVAVGSQLYYLIDGRLIGWPLPGHPLHVTQTGIALVPTEPATRQRWARGPLTQVFGPGVELSAEP